MRKTQTNPRNLPRVHEVDPGTFATMSPRFDWNNVQPMTNHRLKHHPHKQLKKARPGLEGCSDDAFEISFALELAL